MEWKTTDTLGNGKREERNGGVRERREGGGRESDGLAIVSCVYTSQGV